MNNFTVDITTNTENSSPSQSVLSPDSTIVALLLNSRQSLRVLLTNDETRIRIQFFGIYLLFSIVSLFMTVVNVFTNYRMLTLGTLYFAIANIVNVVLCLVNRKAESVARVLFATETIILFTFFIISGEPEGFSAMWSLLLPTCGMFLFRFKYGTMLSLLQFLIIIYLMWIPSGNDLLCYEYTSSFTLRFPLLYLAFTFCGAFFEFIRNNTQEELTKTREQFRYLSVHDPLTGLYNRAGFTAKSAQMFSSLKSKGYAVAIMDIDKFKDVNDTYGHATGDLVLKQLAGIVLECMEGHGIVGRWGGEEFSFVFNDAAASVQLCEQMRSEIEDFRFHFAGVGFKVTASFGLVLVSADSGYSESELMSKADDNLYQSKENGRNQVTISSV